ncbi:hypothetical protein CHUAL_010133 [Chamberlinius hualienensis]
MFVMFAVYKRLEKYCNASMCKTFNEYMVAYLINKSVGYNFVGLSGTLAGLHVVLCISPTHVLLPSFITNKGDGISEEAHKQPTTIES